MADAFGFTAEEALIGEADKEPPSPKKAEDDALAETVRKVTALREFTKVLVSIDKRLSAIEKILNIFGNEV